MDWLKELLGEDLFSQVKEKLGDTKVIKDDGNYIPKARFDEVIQQKNTYKEQSDDLNKQLEKMKKEAKGNEELTGQIQELQNKLNDAEGKNKEISLLSAIKLEAIKSKAKDADVVSMLIDKSKLELTEDGTVKGLEDEFKSLKESKGFLFDEENPDGMGGSKGNFSRNDNNNNNGSSDFLNVIRENQAKK